MGIPDEHSWLHHNYLPHDMASARGWKRRVLQVMVGLMGLAAVGGIVAMFADGFSH